MPDPLVRILDARGLPPPEPMEQTLSALDQLGPGEELQLLLYREPHPLYGILQRSGFTHHTTSEPDGTFVIHIRHAR